MLIPRTRSVPLTQWDLLLLYLEQQQQYFHVVSGSIVQLPVYHATQRYGETIHELWLLTVRTFDLDNGFCYENIGHRCGTFPWPLSDSEFLRSLGRKTNKNEEDTRFTRYGSSTSNQSQIATHHGKSEVA